MAMAGLGSRFGAVRCGSVGGGLHCRVGVVPSRTRHSRFRPGSVAVLHVRHHGDHRHSHNPEDDIEVLRDDTLRRRALLVTNVGVGVNVGLAGLKGVVGWLAASPALVADAVHSLSDLVTDAVTLGAVHYGRQPADEKHPYGHGRFETLGSVAVGSLLVVASGGMAAHSFRALERVVDQASVDLATNAATVGFGFDGSAMTMLGVAVAALSIGSKEWLYRWTMTIAREARSQVLEANAWHHRTDSLSSVVVLGGLGASLVGLPLLDPVAGMAVSAFIGRAGLKVMASSVKELTEEQIDDDIVADVEAIIAGHPEVVEIQRLRARRMGPYILMDTIIRVSRKLSVSAAHNVSESVHMDVLAQVPSVSEVLVGVTTLEPGAKPPIGLRSHGAIEDDVQAAALKVGDVLDVAHTRVHFDAGSNVLVELEIFVDPGMTVKQASSVAARVRQAVESSVHDVTRADVHLELDDSGVWYKKPHDGEI